MKELWTTVKPGRKNGSNHDDESEVFFWDPPSAKNRSSKSQNHVRQLQEQLAQATVRIRDLEVELKRVQKVNNSSLKDEFTDGHQKAEFLRAKQDMVNRIIQMEEKSREAERNTKRAQSDETALINDFRTVLSKLNSLEKLDLVRGALKALETENEKYSEANKQEKSDFDEKFKSPASVNHEPAALKPNFDVSSENHIGHDGFIEASSNRESELYKKIEELEEENKRLFANIEELDQQHEESIEKLLSLKEEIEKKHQCLQNAYEQLYVDHNQAQDKVIQLEGRLQESSMPTRTETVDRSVQTDSVECVDEYVQDERSDELTRKVKYILERFSVEVEPDESIFETLTQQYIDVKWTKDMMEWEIESLQEKVKRLEVENSALRKKHWLRKKNAMIRGPNETRSKSQDQSKLENIPEDIEDTFNTMENLNRRLHMALDENDELRKKIDLLESAKKDVQEQLRMSLEKCKGLDENIEFIEELKLDLENVRRELKTSISNAKQLENSLTLLRDSKDEIQRENEELSQRSEQLEIELSQWRESNSETGNNDTLKDLQMQLTESNREKDDLEYDILNMRKELDEALNQIEMKESAIAKLSQENESLTKEKSSLLEQLTAIQDDSNDKIDLVTTEKSLLEQEQTELKEKITNNEKVLNETRESLREMEERYAKLEDEFLSMNKTAEKLQLENENLQNEIKKHEELKIKELNELTGKLSSMQSDYAQMENEMEMLRLRERELIKLQESFATVTEENKTLKIQYEETKDNFVKLEHLVACLQAEKADLSNRVNESACDNEKQQLVSLLEEKTRENDILKSDNSKLMAKIFNSQKKLQEMMDNNAESADMSKETIESLFHLIKEKDEEINSLKNTLPLAETDKEMSDHFATIKNERDELVKLVTSKHNENVQYHDEIQRLSHLLNEQTLQVQSLLAKKGRNLSELKEKDTQLLSMKNELETMQQCLRDTEESHSALAVEIVILSEKCDVLERTLIQEQSNSRLLQDQLNKSQSKKTSTCSIVEHSTLTGDIAILTEKCNAFEAALIQEQSNNRILQNQLNESQSKETVTCGIGEHSTLAAEIAIVTEKCNALEAALIQEQSNNRMLQNQFNESQSKEANAAKELERLRTHLVEMESSYTEDALLAEEARKELEGKLQQAEEKVKSSSNAYTSASIRANQQVETLQQQIALIIQQRDDIQNKLSTAEDKILSQTASLTNLQIVLEQFQRDKEKDILAATERIQSKLNESHKKQEELANDVVILKEQLAEAKECLQAASRLSEQLDKKTERIEQLSQEVDRLTNLVNTADRRIEEAQQSGEGKVDKTLVKNLLLGYLSSSAADKSSVLRVFSTVLDFNEIEKDKAGLNNVVGQNSWFSRLSGGSIVPNKDQEASLSAAFIRFLENESKPKPQLPALPIQTSPLPRPGHSRQHSTSSTQSTSLLSNVNLPTFPDFIPARNTGSILKEVLKDS
ncbi:hypothetical protein K0M31_002143 [Melipona bicolor]|uniref:GRIP domain-containing protein n=1 Tax=Melipona bicolor TaxID=60889 RepID=A0AA40KYD2_9HYME|nr:hypothetical protein K0M31_002143 [Melipona bicolor]